ncbi:flagellar export chaperone FliS [Texcoconibacillus texcoconensis]|uniref:Flagellar protein FliS n=1 Tax=Texcoconibacillus texcoconensis TaxID=1095777 RepID=A0A840QNS3_9BACI|nr:flagellar export chaperone FliS [Texcoconibacillus texcoconensis]MBB5173019.1 flagellar protein FliS [Texcoconibacillus texcoconensis]
MSIMSKEAIYQKSSQEITTLLYEACVDRLEEAIQAIEERDMLAANEKLQKASDIVERLGSGLNYEAGIISEQLDALYNYIADEIVRANFTKKKLHIQNALDTIIPIMRAWQQAVKMKADKQPAMRKQQMNVYEQNTMYE